jgi:hypothetical protein
MGQPNNLGGQISLGNNSELFTTSLGFTSPTLKQDYFVTFTQINVGFGSLKARPMAERLRVLPII